MSYGRIALDDVIALPCPEQGCDEPAGGIGARRFRCMQDHEFRVLYCPTCRHLAPVASDGFWICFGLAAHHGRVAS